ncbi:MAG: glutamine amidotransferase [Campylobacterales bacterium]|nr:glutamine amidotransferase [Campylobacterales bacterium]
MKSVYILKTGSTFSSTRAVLNDFEDWISSKLDTNRLEVFTVDVTLGERLPELKLCDGIIVTGSHSMVTDEEQWSLEAQKWLVEVVNEEIPLLAICYGHQLLAKALGGVSNYHPHGMEIGTVEVIPTEDAQEDILFHDINTPFNAHTIHSQSVLTLPLGAVRLAYNTHDVNHAFRVGRRAWGVQFHPEFDKAVMDSYIQEVFKEGAFDEQRKKSLLQESNETPEATSILEKFAELVCE